MVPAFPAATVPRDINGVGEIVLDLPSGLLAIGRERLTRDQADRLTTNGRQGSGTLSLPLQSDISSAYGILLARWIFVLAMISPT